jgi:hypothetical protein
VTTTHKYCADCEKALDSRFEAERDFIHASALRPSTDASGHVHQTQEDTCDKCGESKMVSYYELGSDKNRDPVTRAS